MTTTLRKFAILAAVLALSPGVRHAAGLLRDEIDRDMALLGVSQLTELGPGMLVPATRPVSA